MAMNGTDVLLYVNTGTPAVPVYEVVGSQRGLSRDETTAEIDASSKDERAMRVLPGRYGSSMSLDALYVPTDTAYLALLDAMRDGELILVRINEDGADTEEADALVTSISQDYPDQDVATISVDLTVDGEWSSVGT